MMIHRIKFYTSKDAWWHTGVFYSRGITEIEAYSHFNEHDTIDSFDIFTFELMGIKL